MVALILGSALAALAARLGANALQVERSEGERAGLAASLRAGLAYLAHELEAVGADSIAGADLDSVAAGIAFRAQRGLRISCRVVPDTIVVHADTALDWSVRSPVVGRDSLLLYAAGDTAGVIDAWDPLPILSLRGTTCPGSGPALAIGTSFDSARIAGRRHSGRTAVRIFESVAVRAYGGSGGWQVGQEPLSGGGTIQPVAGAVMPGGLSAAAFDRSGVPVPIGPAAWKVRIVLRGRADRQLASGMASRSATVIDSAWATVFLRNLR